MALEIAGDDLSGLGNEAGGHRIQRVPPTERRGRVHSSTVTVAVLDPHVAAPEAFLRTADADFHVEWFHGTIGAGGQHHQKHACCARVRHRPSGLVETRQGRSRDANLRDAKAGLLLRLAAAGEACVARARADDRRLQIGSGQRGDKTVTLRFQADQAVHHGSGRTMPASAWMKGRMDGIW